MALDLMKVEYSVGRSGNGLKLVKQVGSAQITLAYDVTARELNEIYLVCKSLDKLLWTSRYGTS